MVTVDLPSTRAGPIEETGRATRARLCAAGFLAYSSYAICRTPLLPLFARQLGADAPTIGVVVGASTLTGVFLKLPAGAWSDVLGRRPLLVAASLVFAFTPFAYLSIASLSALVILRVIHGSATAIFGPVASATLSDVAPSHRRGTWLSTYSSIQGAGQTLGPVLAGYLIAIGRFDWAFLSAGILALAAPLIIGSLPLGQGGQARVARGFSRAKEGRVGQVGRGILEVARQPLILMTSLAQAAQFVLHGTLSAFLPLFAQDELGLGPAELGWLFGFQTVMTLATRPLMGVISDRVGRRGVIAAGLTLCSAGVLLVSFATSVPTLVAAVMMYAVGVGITTAATSAFITDLSARSQYGAAHGIFGTIYDIGDALGPIAAGVLVASLGYARMFQAIAIMAVAVAAVFSVVSQKGRLPCG